MDIANLPPSELAKHLAKPSGEVGVAVGDYMSRINSRVIEDAYRRLAIEEGFRVLEIGPGNGQSIAVLLGEFANTTYTGIDISQTMLDAAAAANAGHVASGRVALRFASVDAMPFGDATFDRVVSINCVYFWPDPGKAFAEIRRVLMPGGISLSATMTPETAANSTVAKPHHGFHIYDDATLDRLHRAAGFSDLSIETYDEIAKRLDGTPFRRRYFMVRAVA
ncbi:MAG TPA: class I SAM-dependent methyltransferase [Alphaproteobacteria bacterium]|nr:class I SAM-dependent methyltransferase [Alphaproteobacteria bacterium]